MNHDPKICPTCKTPLTDYPSMGYRQCNSCGLTQDIEQPKMCETEYYVDFLKRYFKKERAA